MRAAGVHLAATSENWGAIGIPESVRKLPYLLGQAKQLERLLRADPPDVLVPIDFGAFNMLLLRRLRDVKIRTVYFIPPGCWSRHRKPGELPFLVDGIATPFPWSAENLRRAGAPARIEWVGHPILDYTRAAGNRTEARARLGIPADQPVIAIVPGSRRAELRYLLPVFLDTLARLQPAPLALLSVAPNIGEAAMRQAVTSLSGTVVEAGPHPQPFPCRGRGREQQAGFLNTELPSPAAAGEGLGMEAGLRTPPFFDSMHLRAVSGESFDLRFLDGIDYAAIVAADAALVTSGTATLELACLGVPEVVAYRSSFATWVQYRIVARGGRLRHISLPNILADEAVVPEFLQDAAHPAALADALTPLMTDTPARRAQLDGFAPHPRTPGRRARHRQHGGDDPGNILMIVPV